MSPTVKGYICGIVAAICYGTNPLGALFLYEDGLHPTSVLFYRVTFAAIMLGLLMLTQHKRFKISKEEAKVITALGVLFAASSLTYYFSFKYMDAGISSTILFFYPVMVAVIMGVFFKEKIQLATILAIAMALGGIFLLYKGDGKTTLSITGITLVLISALTYALYIIIVNKSNTRMPSVSMTFYVLVVCSVILGSSAFVENGCIEPLSTPRAVASAIGLGLVPTVFSLVLMVTAVQNIGSTPTAIMGALEPLTAVIIGVTVFGEAMTARLMTGIAMILSAVMIIVCAKGLTLNNMRTFINSIGQKVAKRWRWR